MWNFRRILALVIGFVLLSLLYIFFENKKSDRLETLLAAKKILSLGSGEKIMALRVESKDLYGLEKKDGSWFLTAPKQAPADELLAEGLVAALTNITWERSFALAGWDVKDIGMAPPAQKIEVTIEGKAGRRAQTLMIGNKSLTSATVYAMWKGDEKVMMIQDQFAKAFAKNADAFRKKRVFDFAPDDLKEFVVSIGKTKYAGLRVDGEWRVSGNTKEALDDTSVQKILSAISGLFIKKHLDSASPDNPEFGFNEPGKISVITENGETKTLLVGNDHKDKEGIYAMVEGEGQVLLITSASVKALAKESIFIKKAFDTKELLQKSKDTAPKAIPTEAPKPAPIPPQASKRLVPTPPGAPPYVPRKRVSPPASEPAPAPLKEEKPAVKAPEKPAVQPPQPKVEPKPEPKPVPIPLAPVTQQELNQKMEPPAPKKKPGLFGRKPKAEPKPEPQPVPVVPPQAETKPAPVPEIKQEARLPEPAPAPMPEPVKAEAPRAAEPASAAPAAGTISIPVPPPADVQKFQIKKLATEITLERSGGGWTVDTAAPTKDVEPILSGLIGYLQTLPLKGAADAEKPMVPLSITLRFFGKSKDPQEVVFYKRGGKILAEVSGKPGLFEAEEKVWSELDKYFREAASSRKI